MDRLLTAKEVAQSLGCCSLTLYRNVQRGLFPRPVKVGPQRVRWRESEVNAWLDGLPRAGGNGIADVWQKMPA